MLRIKEIKPLFTNILVTGNKYEKDEKQNGLIIAKKGDLKLYQTVKAVGSMVRDVKVGDQVMINPANYLVRKFSKDSVQNDMDNNPVLRYDFNWVTIDDENGNPQDCLLLNDRDVLYVFEGEEKDDVQILKPSKIILN
jgi:co-chaperonin GroES (HSP10)